MTLGEANRLDIVAKSPEGEIVLVIVAAGDWSADAGMLGQLRTKLQNYVSFAGSEEYRSQYGTAPTRIALMMTHDLSSEAGELVRETSADSGIPIDLKRHELPPSLL